MSLTFLQRGSMDCKGLFGLSVLLIAEVGFRLKKLAAHESYSMSLSLSHAGFLTSQYSRPP